MLRFEDSHDNSPDPLTEIALEELRASGMRDFVQEFIREVGLSRGHSPPENDGNSLQLDGWMRDRLTDLRRGPTLSRQPQVRDFRTVTVCRPQWPDLSHHRSYQEAIEHFSETMKGVKRGIQYIKAEDFPFAKFAAFLNSRFWNARNQQGTLRFLESMLQAYKSRRLFIVWSRMTASLLYDYIQCVDEAGAQYRTSVLRIRCLLWICWDVLRVEGEILFGCSKLLDCWSSPEGYKREKTPLVMKLFATPHMLLLVPWRLTFDLVEDVAELFAEEKPLYLPSAIQQLVMRTGAIALDFYLDGDLSHYFNTHKVLNDDVGTKFTPACRNWMDDVMRSEGRALEANQVVQNLGKMISEGYI